MKKVLLLAFGVLLAANVAFADHLGIYGDAAGTSCTSTALVFPPAVNTTYVIHKFTLGTNGSRFMVVDGSGLFQASNVTPYAVLGGVYTGASVAYGNCLNAPAIVVYTLGHFFFGSGNICGKMEVVPDPIEPSGMILYSDCNYGAHQATGGQFFYQANATCTNCNEVATAATTWGTIKALYR